MRPDLRRVTAVVCESRFPRAAVKLLAAMSDCLKFGDLKYLNHFQGYEQSNYWMNFEVWKYVRTDFALCMQLDGYVIHPELWNPAWLEYDYVGAPWPPEWQDNATGRYRVGNDGFCLKSRRLLQRVAQLAWRDQPSDTLVCCTYRDELEKEGYKFATPEVAAAFSVEHVVPETPLISRPLPRPATFGFHGPKSAVRYPVWTEERSAL